MELSVMPDDGAAPILTAIESARKSIDIAIFRLDMKEVVTGLSAAVKRGVAVRALIAHTNKGGEKALRKLEIRLLDIGATVSRSADEFIRYHAKMMIVDGRRLFVNGYNFTWLDVEGSRSFGVSTTSRRLVQEAAKLFHADCDRQPYVPGTDGLVVSPESSRVRLMAFLQEARKQILIYDPNVSDSRMLRVLAARSAAGVDVRVIGKVARRSALEARRCPGHRLHVRAIIRDGRQAFVGSQSLRALELDRRREIGLIVDQRRVVSRIASVFEADWAAAESSTALSVPPEVITPDPELEPAAASA